MLLATHYDGTAVNWAYSSFYLLCVFGGRGTDDDPNKNWDLADFDLFS